MFEQAFFPIWTDNNNEITLTILVLNKEHLISRNAINNAISLIIARSKRNINNARL